MSKKYKIDSVDIKILEILAKNGRISNIELSNAVGISPSPCLRRVNILIEKGIIKGFYADIDFNYLGYTLVVFASINIDIKDDSEKEEFEKQLLATEEVLEVHTLGSGKDYLVKVLVKDYSDYKIVINTKLARLPFVKNIRTTRISSSIKKSHFVN